MHPGIELNMHTAWTPLKKSDQTLQYPEVVNLGFELMFQQGIKTFLCGIHDHDRHSHVVLAQLDTFVCVCNTEIIYFMVKQHICNFIAPTSICEGLDHCHDLRFRFQTRLEKIEIVHKCPEVDFHYRAVNLALQLIDYLFEGK